MDHDTTRELLELAAAEPGGIDRLTAGDTPAAQAVAAHLAGCSDCTDELARLERTARLIGATLRAEPPADLRERTLSRVRMMGRQRGAAVAAVASVGPVEAALPGGPAVAAATTGLGASGIRPRSSRLAIGFVAAIAAAIVLSVATTNYLVGGRVDQQIAQQADAIHTLEEVTTATLRVTSQPDARHVTLTGSSTAAGILAFSPGTTELVVVATGLTPPPAGQEYRCWIERNGQRQRVGKMFFSQDLAYWIGPVAAVSGLAGPATFGVSLASTGTPAVDASPVIGGAL